MLGLALCCCYIMGRHYIILAWARHLAPFMVYLMSPLCSGSTLCRSYVRSTLCWVDLMSGWPYGGSTLCWVDHMLGRPYVGSTLYRVDLMLGRPFVRSTLCRVDLMLGPPYVRSTFCLSTVILNCKIVVTSLGEFRPVCLKSSDELITRFNRLEC